MKKELKEIISYLDDFELINEKQDIIDSVFLLNESLESAQKAIKRKMHECIDQDEYGKINMYKNVIDKLCTVNNQLVDEGSGTTTIIRRNLDENMDFQSPYMIVLDGKEHYLERHTFRCLFATVMIELAEKSKDKFLALAEEMNKDNKKYCRFAFDTVDFGDDRTVPVELKSVGLYMSYQGDANHLCSKLLFALKYMGLESKYELFIIKKDKKNKKENV